MRTQLSWANQTRMLGQQLQNIGAKFGAMFINAFKPAVIAMNNFLKSVTSFVETILNALGKIFGWEAEVYAAGVPMNSSIGAIADDLGAAGDAADGLGGGAGDAAKGLGDAADNAKKLKQQLQGFDKLNLLTTNADSGSGGGSGGSGGGGSGSGGGGTGGGGADGEGAVTVAFNRTKTAFESEIDSLYELGEYIGDTLTKALKSIDWDSVYSAAQGFGNGLAQFLNGLISDDLFYELGRLVANSINTVFRSLFGFGMAFNFTDLGTAIASGIKGVTDNFDWETIKLTFKIWGKGLAQTINNAITPDTFGSIGATAGKALSSVFSGAGSFFKTLDGYNIGKSVGTAITNFFNNLDSDDVSEAINGAINTLWDAIPGMLDGLHTTEIAAKIAEILSKIEVPKIAITLAGITGFKMAAAGIALAKEAFKIFLLTKILGKLGVGIGPIAGGVATGSAAGTAAGTATGAAAGKGATGGLLSSIGLGAAFTAAMFTAPFVIGGKYATDKEYRKGVQKLDTATSTDAMSIPQGDARNSPLYKAGEKFANLFKNPNPGMSMYKPSWEAESTSVKASVSIETPAKPILKKASDGVSTALKKFPAKLGLTTENKGKKPNVTVNGKIESVTDALPGNKKVINDTTASVNTLKDDVRNKLFGGGSLKVNKLTDAITPAGKVLNNGNIILKSSTDALSKAFKNVNKGNITYSTSKDSLSAKHKNIDKGNITLVSKKMGSAFNYTVGGMKASFTSKEKGAGFSSTIGEMKASFTKKQKGFGFNSVISGMTAEFTKKKIASSFSKVISGFTAKISSWLGGGRADGGVFSAGRWRPVQAYANGGYVNTNGYSSAQLFVAREAGPELVGTIGNHSAVMNNDQIVASVSAGVYRANSEQNSLLRQQNQLLQAILQKETGISTRDVFNAVQSENRRYYARTGKNALVY